MYLIAKLLLNSLYGRFGMRDEFSSFEIVHKDDYIKYDELYRDWITNFIDIGEQYIVETKNPNKYLDNSKEENINVIISAAITAYARIHMSKIKNNHNINLFYSDTDSAYIDGELDHNLVSNTELGKFKLERVCEKAIFIAPKVYGLLDIDRNKIIKVKDLNSEILNGISMNTLEDLLIKDN